MGNRPRGIRVVLGRLSREQRDLVDRHLEFYSSLVVGSRKPVTSARRHFVEVVKGAAALRHKFNEVDLCRGVNGSRSDPG